MNACPDDHFLPMRYPLFLDLREQPVVVVGAGAVAWRKMRALRAAGAQITVISPAARPEIVRWQRHGVVVWKQRRYRRGDLRGAMLVIAATDDPAVNERVCREARERGQLVNCAAPPAAGNFHVPAVVRRGPITVAISTGGASPALARLIRRELEQLLADRYAHAAAEMQTLRRRVAQAVGEPAARVRLYRAAARRLLERKA